jgi:hypothetical protein
LQIRLLQILLVASLLLPAAPLQAFPCAELLSDWWSLLWPQTPKTKVLEWNEAVKLADYYKKGDILITQTNEQLARLGRQDLADALGRMQKHLVENFFRHGFQNTVQHGSAEILSQNYDYAVNVRSEVLMSERELAFEISNDQIKPFPKVLRGKVYAGKDMVVPQSQREGFRGLGVAVRGMSRDLETLPAHTYLEWKADGKRVTFRLVFRLADLLAHQQVN